MFDPGRLNRRVQIMAPAAGVDAIGQPLDGWTEHIAAWADIKTMRGAEAIRADKPASEVNVSIRIRYRPGLGIDAGMRVHHQAAVYHIEAVLVDESGRQWVDLVCKVFS